jgi:glycosyltransferase involved in cell wall biosynthesis
LKVFGLCIVRDEADVIGEALAHAAQRLDRIFVLDNASTDGSYEIARELAARLPNVEVVGQSHEPFRDSLRADLFQRCGDVATDGDWWCRLDADELYVDEPRIFLASVPPRYDAVFATHFIFYFTDRDLEDYERDPSAWLATPVTERLRWYRSAWAELRFVRHDKRMRWVDTPWPDRLPRVHRERIGLRHYRYRSPQQIEQRLGIRRQIFKSGLPVFKHDFGPWSLFLATEGDAPVWRERIAKSSECDFDSGSSELVVRPDLLRPLPADNSDLQVALSALRRRVQRLPGVRVAVRRIRRPPAPGGGEPEVSGRRR